DYEGAAAAFGEAARLRPSDPGGGATAAASLVRAERLRGLVDKLPAVLAGRDEPADPVERADLAEAASRTGRPAAAARLWAAAMAADPKLAAALRTGHRYNTARAAALAGVGKGQDDPPPDDEARARLRGQALGWLKADLVAWAKRLESGGPSDRSA